jgi:hypothetical protein
MRVVFLLSCVLVLFNYSSCLTSNEEPNKLSTQKRHIANKYNLTGSKKGKEAVNEAIDFVLSQEKQQQQKSHGATLRPQPFHYNSNNMSSSMTPSTSKICHVDMKNIVGRGFFLYLGADARPPYDYTCW